MIVTKKRLEVIANLAANEAYKDKIEKATKKANEVVQETLTHRHLITKELLASKLFSNFIVLSNKYCYDNRPYELKGTLPWYIALTKDELERSCRSTVAIKSSDKVRLAAIKIDSLKEEKRDFCFKVHNTLKVLRTDKAIIKELPELAKYFDKKSHGQALSCQ